MKNFAVCLQIDRESHEWDLSRSEMYVGTHSYRKTTTLNRSILNGFSS